MIASTHLTAGAAVGVLSYRFLFKSNSISGMAGALVLGIISHLVLDMIPHSDDELYRPSGWPNFLPLMLSAELLFSFLAIFWCGVSESLPYQNGYLLAGMVGGALPDVPHVLMESLKVDWRILQTADRFNSFFHTSWHAGSFWQGLLPQLVILALSLAVLHFFKLPRVETAP